DFHVTGVQTCALPIWKKKTKLRFKTRNDVFPIGKTTLLPPGESGKTIVIKESGTPDAYHLVTVAPHTRSVINLRNVYSEGIVVRSEERRVGKEWRSGE